MEFIHKFQQNEWYLEEKKEIENYETNIVDYNVMYNMTSRIVF